MIILPPVHVPLQNDKIDFSTITSESLGPLPGKPWSVVVLRGRDAISRCRIDEEARRTGVTLRWSEAALKTGDVWIAETDGEVAYRFATELSKDEDLDANAFLDPAQAWDRFFSLARDAYRPATPIDVGKVALPSPRLRRLFPLALRQGRIERLTARYGPPRLAAAQLRRDERDGDFFLVFPEDGPAPVYYRVQVLAGGIHFAGTLLELPRPWEPKARQKVF